MYYMVYGVNRFYITLKKVFNITAAEFVGTADDFWHPRHRGVDCFGPCRPEAPGHRFQLWTGAELSDRERDGQVNQCVSINTGNRQRFGTAKAKRLAGAE